MAADPTARTGRRFGWIALAAAQAVAVVGVNAALRSKVLPLGVPGEWEWSRITFPARLDGVALACVSILIYAGYCIFGYACLSGPGESKSRVRTGVLLVGLAIAAGFTQVMVQEGAPPGYGLTKWVMALQGAGSSGYYTVIKRELKQKPLSQFVREYPEWIKGQDALHTGTHPPGLFIVAAVNLDLMQRHPAWGNWLLRTLPPSVEGAYKVIKNTDIKNRYRDFQRDDAASLAFTGLLTLLACAGTVIPLHVLARNWLPPAESWAAACLWPLVPSAVLFQPVSDTFYPFLSTLALALAVPGARRIPTLVRAVLSGLVMGLGMQFSLVFLPVGLIAAILVLSRSSVSWPDRWRTILAIGAGFLGFTLGVWLLSGANPFAIWWSNQKNHARFYVEYPRSYLPWVIANAVELCVALGLASTLALSCAVVRPRSLPLPTLATLAVLIVLTLSGKNLSEIARLWLPLLPPLLLGSSAGLKLIEAGKTGLAWTLILSGIQVLMLESLIQVVYPIGL